MPNSRPRSCLTLRGFRLRLWNWSTIRNALSTMVNSRSMLQGLTWPTLIRLLRRWLRRGWMLPFLSLQSWKGPWFSRGIPARRLLGLVWELLKHQRWGLSNPLGRESQLTTPSNWTTTCFSAPTRIFAITTTSDFYKAYSGVTLISTCFYYVLIYPSFFYIVLASNDNIYKA